MHFYKPTNQTEYPVVVFVKAVAFNPTELYTQCVSAFVKAGVPESKLLFLQLPTGKINKSTVFQYMEAIAPHLFEWQTKILYVPDAAIFKLLTGQKQAEKHIGYTFPCVHIPEIQVTYGVNHKTLYYSTNDSKYLLSLKTVDSFLKGEKVFTTTIIKDASYPSTHARIEKLLFTELMNCPTLSADIETFSLHFFYAGIGTIAFGKDTESGAAFAVDYVPCDPAQNNNFHGQYIPNPELRALLKAFFTAYRGTLIWHGSGFDLKVLIYTLWMKDLSDTAGLLQGLEIMTRLVHDTKIIAYLALNTCAGNELGLKVLAQEFAGNWAQEEIKDIRKIPLKELLEYNLIDALSTNYVFNKYYPKMVMDDQLSIYRELMLPTQKLLHQVELSGMPLNPERLNEVEGILLNKQNESLDKIHNNPWIIGFNKVFQLEAMRTKNASLKVKQYPIEHFAHLIFNPCSNQQLQELLFVQMGLESVETTDSGAPSTSGKVLKTLFNKTTDPVKKELVGALLEYAKVTKIIGTFLKAFKKAISKGDGRVYLFGNFVVGGTVSGRLSSNSPNLQNLPSGSEYGDLIKSCFSAPRGKCFIGADFKSLEATIDALLTQDPNKLKVLTDGYDSHCFATYTYWPSLFTHLQETPEDVNTIKETHEEKRKKSKGVTFAKQYGGTWITLVNNSGFTEEEAKAIEENYNRKYVVSLQWKEDAINLARQQGYYTTAFGFRIRCPLLQKTFFTKGGRNMREADEEARTLGNAIGGQSYGLLNNRAAIAFMQRVWASPYKHSIQPVALIHDALYFVCDDNVEQILWINKTLTEEMSWQDLPELQHPVVKLGGDLDIFWPAWNTPMTLPNNCTEEQLYALIDAHKAKLESK